MASPAPAAPTAAPTVPAASTNALMLMASRLKEYSSNAFKQRKPWSELLDRNTFSKPANLSEAASRLRKNAIYFRDNYIIIMLLTTAVTFLMHPSSLLVLGALAAAWIYVLMIRTAPIKIGERTLSDREKLLGLSAISFITIFFLTSVGTVFFSALSLSLALLAAHGAFREPDNLFLDEATAEAPGFLGIFTAPAAPMGAAAMV